MIFIPDGAEVRKATPIAITPRRNCRESIQRRLVAYSSICGPQRNLMTHGMPKREVRPIASRLTFMSRKKTEETMRMMV